MFHARFQALTHMAAGMEIVEISGQSRHPAQIVRQHISGKGPGLRIGGAQVHGVGTVGHQGTKIVFFQHSHCFGCIGRIFLFGAASPRIAGEEGKGIGPDGQGGFHHGGISLGGRQMAS